MNYGYYHLSWVGDAAKQRADLLTAAAAGCSLMHLSYLGNVKTTRSLLDAAQVRGMSVILEDIEGADLKTLSSHPAFLARSVCDDANRQTVAEVQTRCTAEATLPRYISIGPGIKDSLPALYGLSEIVGVQSYPFPSEALLSSYLVWSAARTNADAAGVRVFGNAQVYPQDGALPSPEQIRAQVWLAAACGLDGLLAYTMLDETGPVAPAQHKAFVTACAEVNALTSSRATVTLSPDRLTLTALWPGGVKAVIDLSENARVISLNRR